MRDYSSTDGGQRSEQRQFTRVETALVAVLRQGSVTWEVTLQNLSLGGFAVSRPGGWDAQYNEPFSIEATLPSGDTLELFAHLDHVKDAQLGFLVEHVDDENLASLRALLEASLDDPLVIAEEMSWLDRE
jgi:hypothetical protein